MAPTILITKTKDTQWRPCKLNGKPLKDIAGWPEHYRSYWEESFDRLEEYLKTIVEPQEKGQEDEQEKKPK